MQGGKQGPSVNSVIASSPTVLNSQSFRATAASRLPSMNGSESTHDGRRRPEARGTPSQLASLDEKGDAEHLSKSQSAHFGDRKRNMREALKRTATVGAGRLQQGEEARDNSALSRFINGTGHSERTFVVPKGFSLAQTLSLRQLKEEDKSSTPAKMKRENSYLLQQAQGGGGGKAQPESTLEQLNRSVANFLNSFELLRCLLDHHHSRRRTWNGIVFMFVLWSVITLPMRIAFFRSWSGATTFTACLVFDYVGDVVFLFDILLSCFTPYERDDGKKEHDETAIQRHYFTKGWGKVDVLSSLPLGFISFEPRLHAILRLCRMLRLAKVQDFYELWEEHSSGHERVVRFAKLMLFLGMIFHLFGCIYYTLAYWKGFCKADEVEECWFPIEEYDETLDFSARYTTGFFWAANILTNKGGGVLAPQNDFQRGITLIVGVVATLIEATIIGAVVGLVSSMSRESQEFKDKMARLNLFMQNRKLDGALQDEIRNYFINILQHRGHLDHDDILDELPNNLRTQAIHHINEGIINKCRLFRNNRSKNFTNALVAQLKPQVNMPGDIITREGTMGSEMFFVRRGKVNVLVETHVVRSLKQGAFFGEIALLLPDQPRTASVQAAEFCDLFVLTKEALDTILNSFPEERGRLRREAAKFMAVPVLEKHLQQHHLFRRLPKAFITSFAGCFVPQVYDGSHERTQYIFRAEDKAEALYFLCKGEVEFQQRKPVADDDKGTEAGKSTMLGKQGSLSRLRRAVRRRDQFYKVRLKAMTVRNAEDGTTSKKGFFFGGIGSVILLKILQIMRGKKGEPTYGVSCLVPPDAQEHTILFRMDEASFNAFLKHNPAAYNLLCRFVGSYRTMFTVAVQKFLQSRKNSRKIRAPVVSESLREYMIGRGVDDIPGVNPGLVALERREKQLAEQKSQSHSSSFFDNFEDDDADERAELEQVHEANMSALLQNLSQLKSRYVDIELSHLTTPELLLASESLQALIQKLTRRLWEMKSAAPNQEPLTQVDEHADDEAEHDEHDDHDDKEDDAADHDN